VTPSRSVLLAALLAAPAPAAAAVSAPLSSAQLGALFDGSRAGPPGLDAIDVSTGAAARQASAAGAAASGDLDSWLALERRIALLKMEMNISPAGAAPGAVAASPSRKDPDYFFHWRRDAALTMQEIVVLYEQSADSAEKASYFKMLTDYAAFVKKTQSQSALTGLGEPKFNMDGTPFNGPWGRPQDDAPAEEASTLIEFASALLKQGRKDLARELYGSFSDGIKGDLEYVSHHWEQTSFDVWEEVKAHHFDTETAQRQALLEGAWLAEQLGDDGAPQWYRAQAARIAGRMNGHWDAGKGYIVSARDQDAGLGGKDSGLDAAVILAAIHRRPLDSRLGSSTERGFFSVTDARVLATAQALSDRFRAQYSVNRRPGEPGIAIGRYPEDSYFGGNPWALLTAAFAQLDYMAARDFLVQGAIPIDDADLAFFRELALNAGALGAGISVKRGEPLFDEIIAGFKTQGDSYLAEVRAHANPDGSLSEQIDKDTGVMMSAKDLTWNYASVLSALSARDALNAARR
jgi:glucoamylase